MGAQKQFLKDAIAWGLTTWLIGYALGLIAFMLVPAALIGWVVMPFGIAISLWILFRKTHGATMRYYLGVACAWTIIAVACDYLFLVKLLNPADGYYKPDVYLYYALTFALPMLVGWKKTTTIK